MNASRDTAARPMGLRRAAQGLAAPLPPLLVEASQLAANVQLGEHGRRRSGMGSEFWQYRPAHSGDEARFIDWRRSARSDQTFVREREWQAAQSVHLWVDASRSMDFTGDRNRPPKGARARLLALALAVLMIRAGERVGLSEPASPPRAGEVQLMRLAHVLSTAQTPQDYGAPAPLALLPGARAVFLSDFLGPLDPVEAALARAADLGVRGAMVQILDPVEESFPFDGRAIFESMAGTLRHETLKAGNLRARYLDRMAERRARLTALAARAGWVFSTHHTDQAAQSALLWLYAALRER